MFFVTQTRCQNYEIMISSAKNICIMQLLSYYILFIFSKLPCPTRVLIAPAHRPYTIILTPLRYPKIKNYTVHAAVIVV